MGSGFTSAESLLATQLVMLVVSGATAVLLASGAVWAGVRAVRALLALARARLMPRLYRAWAHYRFRKLPVAAAGAQLSAGGLVRIQGVVEAERVPRAELSGVPSVVSRYEVDELGGGAVGRGLQARDFSLRLEDGSRVRVLAGAAAEGGGLRLVDREPQRWRGERGALGWLCESRVQPGAHIEVVGELTRQVDAGATRPLGSDRQPPLGWAVLPRRTPFGAALVLRFATPSGGER